MLYVFLFLLYLTSASYQQKYEGGLKKNKKKVQHPLNPTMKVRSDLHNPSSLLGFWVGDYYTQAPCALYTILYSIYINLDVYVMLRNAPEHAAAYVYGVYGNSIDCA